MTSRISGRVHCLRRLSFNAIRVVPRKPATFALTRFDLPGGIHLEDLGDRNLVRPRHGQDSFADFLIFERLVLVEERLDVDRRNHNAEGRKKRPRL